MRHSHAWSAIPDFPLSLGRVIPPLDYPLVAIHFAHRVGAYLVVAAVCSFALRLLAKHRQQPLLSQLAASLLLLVAVQFALGVSILFTLKAVVPTTLHVAVGALTLAATLVACLFTFRQSTADAG
jgi:cytochrome c oxidase assembly protein subunit 15